VFLDLQGRGRQWMDWSRATAGAGGTPQGNSGRPWRAPSGQVHSAQGAAGKWRHVSAIIRQTGFHGRTVTKWMQVDELPPRSVMAPKRTTPVRFQSHLGRCWAEGCTSRGTLLLEIKGLGYSGSLSQLNRLLTEWRRTDRPAAAAEATTLPLRDAATGHLVSPIVAAALCVRPRGMLTPIQAVIVDAFKASSAEFAAMRALAMRFRSLLHGSDVEKLNAWLNGRGTCRCSSPSRRSERLPE